MEDRIVGRHVYGSLYGVDEELSSDKDYLEDVVRAAADLSNAKILEVKSWEIPGEKGGVSVLALIIESHIAVHTWPRYRYATVDVYTCGHHTDPIAAFSHIASSLKPERYTMTYAERSQLPLEALSPEAVE